MSKKNRKNRKPHSVLRSLKDLSADGRDTLSRLATTVKADMPTLMLGGKATGTVKNDGYQHMQMKPASRLSRFAKKFVPLRAKPSKVERDTTRKMQKLAHQMAKGNPKMKTRRSRLPFVVVMLVLLTVGGGYYTYQHISLPTTKISQFMDYKSWLGLASGEVKPGYKSSNKSNVARSYQSYDTYSSTRESTHKASKYSKSSHGSKKQKHVVKAKSKGGKKAKIVKSSKGKTKGKAKLAKLKHRSSKSKIQRTSRKR